MSGTMFSDLASSYPRRSEKNCRLLTLLIHNATTTPFKIQSLAEEVLFHH